jgi:chaperonin cofactor prefoldin
MRFQQQVIVPKSSQELAGLIARRDELNSQLESLNDQRGELAHQVQSLGNDEVRSGPMARLKALDARIGKVESEIAASDDAIATAKANGISEDDAVRVIAPKVHVPEINIPPIPSFNFGYTQPPWRVRVRDSLLTTAPITIASIVLVGAVLYWRISRTLRNQFATLVAAQQSRLDELQRSVDTVAVEIERVSENQRFVTKLVGDRTAAPVERH